MKRFTKMVTIVFFTILMLNVKVLAANYSGDSFDTAMPLAIGGEVFGNLSTDCRRQYITFTTSGNKSWYQITGINSSCNDDIEMQLYNADRSKLSIGVLGTDSKSCIAPNSAGQILLELTPNTTYYLLVESAWDAIPAYGDFKVNLTEIIDDYGDTYSTCKSLTLGNEISGNINVSKDIDFFKFTTDADENCYYNINLINIDASELTCQLYDGNLVKDDYTYAYKNEQCNILKKLAPNQTYYLGVSDSAGNYKLKVTKTPDDAYDSYDKAKQIGLNSKYNMGIQAPKDIDYLKFKTNSKDTDYTIQVSAKSAYISYELFDANQQRVDYSKGTSAGSTTKNKFSLKKNKTYYLKVSGNGVSDYSIKINCKTVATYKIKYNLNGGKNNTSNPTTYTGTKEIKLKNPTRRGYQFKGWYTDKSFKHPINKIAKGSAKNYTLYAKWSKINLKACSIKSLKNKGNGKVQLIVNKVSNADGYEILVATDKKMTANKSTYTMSSTNKTLKLKKGKTYYVRVRAYALDSTGEKVYGKNSSIKKIKL